MHRLAGLLIAAAVLAGPPTVVTVWAAHHDWRRPTAAQLQSWAQQPLTESTLAVGTLAAGLLLWLFVLVVAVRGLTRNAGVGWRRLRRMRLPTPAQATAGSLAGAALFAAPALTPPVAGTPTPPATGNTDLHHPDGGVAAVTDTDTTPGDDAHPDEPDSTGTGVTLPDGSWVQPNTAQQVAATVNLLWIRRRMRYQGGQPYRRHDTDLTPPPAAATLISSAAAGRAATPTAPDDLPAAGVDLTGPGAAAAARGLLVAALLTGSRRHVLTTRRDLGLLLGAAAQRFTTLDGLTVADTSSSFADCTEAALVITHDRIDEHLLPATAITVTLTDVGPGPHWHVSTDGHVRHDGPRPIRLSVLSEQVSTDLLDLAHNARAEHSTPGTVLSEQRTVAQLSVLGRMRLTVGGQQVTVTRTAARQTLVLLALHPQGLPAHDIIADVWPGLAPRTITDRLYTTLSTLRKNVRQLTDAELITRDRDRYLLDAAVIDVDLWHLNTATSNARGARSPAAHHAVINRYHGELAAGESWPWLAPHREATRRDVIDAYIAAAATADEPADTVRLLRQAIAIEPYNEDLHRRAVQASLDAHDAEGARALHDAFTRRLASHGLQPSNRTAATTGDETR